MTESSTPAVTRQSLPDPLVTRLRLLDGARVSRTLWSAVDRDGVPPLRVTVDHVWRTVERLGGPADSLAGVRVWLHEVREPRLRAGLSRVAPRSLRLSELGADAAYPMLGLALDVWLPETAWQAQAVGHHAQHWLFPRLVLERKDVTPPGGPVLLDDMPDGTADPVDAHVVGLALEVPPPRGDLWWPPEAPDPVRAYQWIREAAVPPVPVG